MKITAFIKKILSSLAYELVNLKLEKYFSCWCALFPDLVTKILLKSKGQNIKKT